MASKIIIHGGFFSESATNQAMKLAKQKAISDIVEKGYNYLLTHTALEAVTYAVSLLEDCDLFNAGLGSQIQRDGKIRLSASVMDGKSKKFGGVINIRDVKNPVQIARMLMDQPDSVLSDEGALNICQPHQRQYLTLAVVSFLCRLIGLNKIPFSLTVFFLTNIYICQGHKAIIIAFISTIP